MGNGTFMLKLFSYPFVGGNIIWKGKKSIRRRDSTPRQMVEAKKNRRKNIEFLISIKTLSDSDQRPCVEKN